MLIIEVAITQTIKNKICIIATLKSPRERSVLCIGPNKANDAKMTYSLGSTSHK
jgi:hypothetical protein